MDTTCLMVLWLEIWYLQRLAHMAAATSHVHRVKEPLEPPSFGDTGLVASDPKSLWTVRYTRHATEDLASFRHPQVVEGLLVGRRDETCSTICSRAQELEGHREGDFRVAC